MSLYKNILTSLLIFFGLLSLRAETLETIALEILKNSPEYKSDDYSLEASSLALKTESNLPDPELSGEYLVMPQDIDNRWTAQIEWGVEWPGVYKARGKEADRKMTAAQAALYAKRVEQLAEIKDLLLQYVMSQKKLAILQELHDNNDTIRNLAEQAAKGGEITRLDLNKIHLEYANIHGAMIGAEDEKMAAVTSLSKIYGGDCATILQNLDCVFPEIRLPSSEEIERLKDVSPVVAAALMEAEAARESLNVTRMEALPSLSLGYKHQYEDGMHFNGVVAGVSIPIFSSRGKKKATKAEIVNAEYKAEAAGIELETQALALRKRLESLDARIKEMTPLIENDDYNAYLLKAYKGGAITLLDYITDRNYFTNAALELLNLRYSAASIQVALEKYL